MAAGTAAGKREGLGKGFGAGPLAKPVLPGIESCSSQAAELIQEAK